MAKRLIVGITGATGAVYGVEILRTLKSVGGWESHLVLSDAGALNVWHELKMKRREVERLADLAYHPKDIAATISSGSYLTDGMVIAPCSMKTLAAVAHAHADDLVSRAADVVLKERRRLVLVPRETPLSEIHLENLLKLARMGVCILPPMAAFYNRPASLDDMVDHIVARALDQFDIDASFARRWDGVLHASKTSLRRA
jgi:polyprenyl P-hydroxybenzoate/phenylacrylic acid decarboxylase-like protein